MSNEFVIYSLSHPVSRDIVYIGMSKNLERRICQHYQSHNTELRAWLQTLVENKLEPIVAIIERCPTRLLAKERETHWIEFYASRQRIFNIRSTSGCVFDNESRPSVSKKTIVTLSLDSDVIDTLKKQANGNFSRYANQMLKKVLGLEDIVESNESYERIAAIEDFLSERMEYQKRVNRTRGVKFAK